MFLRKVFPGSPTAVRIAPFVIFVLLTAAQGKYGPASAYWFYFAKTLAGAWLVWEMWPLVAEMRWAFSWEAIVVGAGVFALWVGLDPCYPHANDLLNRLSPSLQKIGLGFLGSDPKPAAVWNPNVQFGAGSALAWLFIVTRIVGSSLVVPPLEEVFYRSFLYRYLARVDFLAMPLNQFRLWPFLMAALIFGFSHHEWLAGILCAAAYQWLVLRKNRLGDAMTAHALTNFLLGLWVVWKDAWNFW